ncbi:hypothetical protein BAMTA208_17535 [Bacillus amyloliquefaciens TA208]|nr:hypothetical protein BAMTA208_17535 [Bacillus amyloliquefaciens TA208]
MQHNPASYNGYWFASRHAAETLQCFSFFSKCLLTSNR